VWENAQVKLGGFFGVVIEPEEWRNFVHGWHGTNREVTSDKPTFRDQSACDPQRRICMSDRLFRLRLVMAER
jgi:hypothetical protein